MTNPAACIGDFPHIGTDNYGVYLTTNEYRSSATAQKVASLHRFADLCVLQVATDRNAASPTMVSFENPALGPFRSFTVWPAISPAGQASNESGGTEFFLSSTLGDGSETGNLAPSENRIGVWAITNTSSIDSAEPNLKLSNKLIKADTYTMPPATQKDGPTPLRDCINDTSDLFGTDPATGANLGCWYLFFDPPAPPHADLTTMDSSDTRMNQVIYSGGRLYGAIGTGVKVGGSTRAGVLWVNVDAKVKKGRLRKPK